jgi:transposase-like protein
MGKRERGRQRFQCKRCKQTFNERKGMLFYNRKTDEKDILECLALLVEGARISSISRTKGIKEDTILLNDYRIKRVQIDGLWTYVGHKKGATSER